MKSAYSYRLNTLRNMRREIVKGLLIDLSGTIHIDKKEIPGAVEAIRKLRESGLPYR
jgi:ribonucleotide monophosphatase NagD (HAD superfamily)